MNDEPHPCRKRDDHPDLRSGRNCQRFHVDHRLKKKLHALAERFPEQIRLTETLREGGAAYTIPKNCIVIYPPHGETWRKAVTERAKTKGFQKKTEK